MASLRTVLVTFFLLFTTLAAAWPLNPRGGRRCEKSANGYHTCPQGEYCNTVAFAVPAYSIKKGKPLQGLCMISSAHGSGNVAESTTAPGKKKPETQAASVAPLPWNLGDLKRSST